MMGGVRRAAILISASLSACSFSPSHTLVSEPLPDDVDYTALLFAAENGSIFASTGLVARQLDDPLGVPLPDAIDEASSVHLLGFRRPDLLQLGFEERHASEELSLASPAEPVLPPPAWYGTSRISSGRGTLERAGEPPFVTAPWVAPCASLIPGESRLVDSECHGAYCALVAEQIGCALSIRTDDPLCLPAELEGRIDGGGRLVIEGCETSEPNAGASAAVECDGIRPFRCRIELHGEAAEPLLTLRSYPLIAPSAAPPDQTHPAIVGGYLFGLEVFDDRIVVASDAGRAAWVKECPSLEPGVFHFLDPETLEEIGSAPSPACVRDLMRVPGAEELYAVYGAEDARRLGRFSKDGTLLEDAAIPERAGADYPAAILVHQLSSRVSLAFDGEGTSQYFAFRRQPLAWEWSSEVLEDFVNHQEREENVLSILHRRHDELHLLDMTRPPADMRSPFYPSNVGTALKFREICEDIQLRMEQMLFIPGEGWLMGSRGATTGAMARLSLDGTDCDVVRWFEGPAEIYDFMLVPGNPNLVLTAIRRTDDGTAHLALMNRSEARFLTGSIEVGSGAIDHMRADSRGRIYFALPWSGHVARAEMR
jgi:hypothetical protein